MSPHVCFKDYVFIEGFSNSFFSIHKKMKLDIVCLLPFLHALLSFGKTVKVPLQMLTLLPFNNNGKVSWPSCLAAIQFVFKHVNQRDDILADYHLEEFVGDQGSSAYEANARLAEFLRNENKTIFKSPVIFGPTISCQWSSLTVRNVDMVTFSPQCAGPFIRERKHLYSTLYSAMAPAMTQAWSMLYFIKHVGQWKEIAVVTNRNNPNEYKRGEFLTTIAIQHGIKVLYYANEYKFTDGIMQELKRSNARIIGVVINQRPNCVDFLCMAYRNGIRAPLYVFVFTTFNCMIEDVDAIALPEGCSRDMLETQSAGIVSAGTFGGWPEIGGEIKQTHFGYDYNYFQNEFLNLTEGLALPDFDTRLSCHDAAVASVLTLNQSDHILKQNFNLTLKDWEQNSKLIGKIVNESASKLDFQSLRIGRFKYSKNGELAEDLWIGQSLHGKGSRILYRLKNKGEEGKESVNLDSFEPIRLNDITWFTQTGEKPKDLSQVEIRHFKFPTAVVAVPMFFLGCHSLILSILPFSFNRQNKNDIYFRFPHKMMVVLICFVLNLSAAVHIFGPTNFTQVECHFKYVPTAIANGFVTSLVCINLWCYLKFVASKAPQRQPSGQSRPRIYRSVTFNLHPWVNTTFITIVTLLIAIVMIVWSISDPMHLSIEYSDIEMDFKTASYVKSEILSCSSQNQHIWIAILLIIHCLHLISILYPAIALKNYQIPRQYVTNCQKFRLTALNLTTIASFFVLISLILDSNYQYFSLIVACFEFFTSFSASLLLFDKKIFKQCLKRKASDSVRNENEFRKRSQTAPYAIPY